MSNLLSLYRVNDHIYYCRRGSRTRRFLPANHKGPGYVSMSNRTTSIKVFHGQSSVSQHFALPPASPGFHLTCSSITIICNWSATGWKRHLNPGQVLESSQSLCSCRIFGHSRPPFDGCWMMRRLRNCFNFTTFPAEQRQIRGTMTNIYQNIIVYYSTCSVYATSFEEWTWKILLNLNLLKKTLTLTWNLQY